LANLCKFTSIFWVRSFSKVFSSKSYSKFFTVYNLFTLRVKRVCRLGFPHCSEACCTTGVTFTRSPRIYPSDSDIYYFPSYNINTHTHTQLQHARHKSVRMLSYYQNMCQNIIITTKWRVEELEDECSMIHAFMKASQDEHRMFNTRVSIYRNTKTQQYVTICI